MNIKNTLVCLFQAAFLFLIVHGQNETPKFIWTNMQPTYESFKDFKPIIELQDVDHVLIATYPRYNLLMRFDDKKKDWVAGFDILTDNLGQHGNIFLRKNRPMETFFFWEQFFVGKNYHYTSFVSQDNVKYAIRGKYKIRVYYGTEMDKFDKYTDSPEFILAINKLTSSIRPNK